MAWIIILKINVFADKNKCVVHFGICFLWILGQISFVFFFNIFTYKKNESCSGAVFYVFVSYFSTGY